MKKNSDEDDLNFFKETFRLLNDNPRMFRYRLKSAGFTIPQKNLLNAYFLYKKKKSPEETIELLRNQKFDSDFYEGIKSYLIGISNNHIGKFSFAIEHLTRSAELLSKIKNEDFVLYPLIILILTLGNQKKTAQMKHYVELMDQYRPYNQTNELSVIHAKALYLVLANHFDEAQSLLQKTLSKDYSCIDDFKPSFLILSFSISLNQRDYEGCYDSLEEYKKSNGFVTKVNYLYMKSLLDLIVKDKPLYVYEQDYREYPEILDQLEMLKALVRGDIETSKKYWATLARHNPDLYQDDFNYTGGVSLFSLALDKYSYCLKESAFDKSVLNGLHSPMEKIHYLFTASSSPLKKDELISLIWGDEVNDVTLNRLRNLIFKYKKQFGAEVVAHQETYLIKKAS